MTGSAVGVFSHTVVVSHTVLVVVSVTSHCTTVAMSVSSTTSVRVMGGRLVLEKEHTPFAAEARSVRAGLAFSSWATAVPVKARPAKTMELKTLVERYIFGCFGVCLLI